MTGLPELPLEVWAVVIKHSGSLLSVVVDEPEFMSEARAPNRLYNSGSSNDKSDNVVWKFKSS